MYICVNIVREIRLCCQISVEKSYVGHCKQGVISENLIYSLEEDILLQEAFPKYIPLRVTICGDIFQNIIWELHFGEQGIIGF